MSKGRLLIAQILALTRTPMGKIFGVLPSKSTQHWGRWGQKGQQLQVTLSYTESEASLSQKPNRGKKKSPLGRAHRGSRKVRRG